MTLHQHLVQVMHCDSLAYGRVLTSAEEGVVGRVAGLLDVPTREVLLEDSALLRSIDSVDEAVLHVIVEHRNQLRWLFADHRLEQYSTEVDSLPRWVDKPWLPWLQFYPMHALNNFFSFLKVPLPVFEGINLPLLNRLVLQLRPEHLVRPHKLAQIEPELRPSDLLRLCICRESDSVRQQ